MLSVFICNKLEILFLFETNKNCFSYTLNTVALLPPPKISELIIVTSLFRLICDLKKSFFLLTKKAKASKAPKKVTTIINI